MLCAVCLFEVSTQQSPSLPHLYFREAVTIANGQAVCEAHLLLVYPLISPDYGLVALAALRNPHVQQGSRPPQST